MSANSEWELLELNLKALRQGVARRIADYPPPIPACDEQFNYLIEQRRLLIAELARCRSAARDGTSSVEEFIAVSPLKEELSKPAPT